MAVVVKHQKTSAVADSGDTNLVQPSDWNADHTLTGLGSMAEADTADYYTAAEVDAGFLAVGAVGAVAFASATITLANGAGVWEAESVVSVPGVTASQRANVWLAPGSDADENVSSMVDLNTISAACETDALRVFMSFREPQSGPILIQYQVA